ncbi:sporulation protein YjcZ [Cohnella zeiphila]|uniref:Sporulation protein YjcZ n=1 Tax=Cohnella zeiphila TaxID=2761120 RepID=A0A7X0SKG2_9BACL|nr:sporulation protein YjcZ [Cohnella zeiphila]MBB6729408.1 sporulation protein YjcZ [Cohnella zeiphila]
MSGVVGSCGQQAAAFVLVLFILLVIILRTI